MRIGKAAPRKYKKREPGCPTKFRSAYIIVAHEACLRLGATIEDLARLFSCTIPTIYNWMRDNEQFAHAVRTGRDSHDTRKVERALVHRAMGYMMTVTKERVAKDLGIVSLDEQIHVPAQVEAQMFYLCNRNPQRWKSISAKLQQAFFDTKGKPIDPTQPQLNAGNGEDKGNGKDKDANNGIEAIRQVLNTLRDAGELDVAGDVVQGPGADPGADSKAN